MLSQVLYHVRSDFDLFLPRGERDGSRGRGTDGEENIENLSVMVKNGLVTTLRDDSDGILIGGRVEDHGDVDDAEFLEGFREELHSCFAASLND
jgi:hypothetical protein